MPTPVAGLHTRLCPANTREAAPTWLQVVDVGGGTGFCTQGVVKAGIPPANITLIDQSPQQVGCCPARSAARRSF